MGGRQVFNRQSGTKRNHEKVSAAALSGNYRHPKDQLRRRPARSWDSPPSGIQAANPLRKSGHGNNIPEVFPGTAAVTLVQSSKDGDFPFLLYSNSYQINHREDRRLDREEYHLDREEYHLDREDRRREDRRRERDRARDLEWDRVRVRE